MGGDVHDGAVQLLDLDVKLADGDLELLAGLRDCDLLLRHILHLGQQLVHFRLELGLLLLGPGGNEMAYADFCSLSFETFIPYYRSNSCAIEYNDSKYNFRLK